MKKTITKNAKRNGFTLIELLIVVAILGILYSVALPTYTKYMERSRRADIQQIMLQHGASLERIYSRNGGYPNVFNATTNTDFYTFNYAAFERVPGAAAGINFKNRAYTLKATPKAGSAQSGDLCGVLTISHNGKQLPHENNCWN